MSLLLPNPCMVLNSLRAKPCISSFMGLDSDQHTASYLCSIKPYRTSVLSVRPVMELPGTAVPWPYTRARGGAAGLAWGHGVIVGARMCRSGVLGATARQRGVSRAQ